MWEMHYCFQLTKWDFQMYWRCVVCFKVDKEFVIDQSINKIKFQGGN